LLAPKTLQHRNISKFHFGYNINRFGNRLFFFEVLENVILLPLDVTNTEEGTETFRKGIAKYLNLQSPYLTGA